MGKNYDYKGPIRENEYDYNRITEDIKKDEIPSVILLFGAEQFHVEWATAAIIEKYVNPITKDLDLTIFNEKPSLDELINACETLTMFSQEE